MKKKKKQYQLPDSAKDIIVSEVNRLRRSLLRSKRNLHDDLHTLVELEMFLQDDVDENLYADLSNTMDQFGNVLAMKLGYSTSESNDDIPF